MSKESLLEDLKYHCDPGNFGFIHEGNLKNLINKHLPDEPKMGDKVIVIGGSNIKYYGKVTDDSDFATLQLNDAVQTCRKDCRIATPEEQSFFNKLSLD